MIIADNTVLSWEHIEIFLAGSTGLSLIAHAVDTFPTPANKYGQWVLGLIKWFVGQRQSAKNAFAGQDTVTAAVPQGMGTGPGTATQLNKSTTEITPEAITVTDLKQSKTIIPNPNPEGKDK